MLRPLPSIGRNQSFALWQYHLVHLYVHVYVWNTTTYHGNMYCNCGHTLPVVFPCRNHTIYGKGRAPVRPGLIKGERTRVEKQMLGGGFRALYR